MSASKQWVLYTHKDHGLVILSKKPFKSKEEAEKVRLKYPDRERRQIGIGRL